MTVPHTSGTITLVKGSAIVNGTDTAWQTALIVAGVIFVNVPNSGGFALPILSVDSNTKITATMPWQGANGTYSYTLLRDNDRQTSENAVKLASLLTEMRSAAVSALAGLTPAADKLPYFGANGAGALADFNAAARALLAGTGVLPDAQLPDRLVNRVITSANNFKRSGWGYGENVPGSPEVGSGAWFTYVNDIDVTGNWGKQTATSWFRNTTYVRLLVSGSWQPWLAAAGVSVGTVSQIGGVSTGAIIERGSNANGEYVRFADGTQICWGNFVGYTANVIKGVTTAASFSTAIKPCFVSVTPFGAPDASPEAWSDAINGLNFRSSITSTTNRVDYCVIGRWY